jgi:hypothetical protein
MLRGVTVFTDVLGDGLLVSIEEALARVTRRGGIGFDTTFLLTGGGANVAEKSSID